VDGGPGPGGLQVSASGLVSGWTTAAGDFGNNIIEIQATNSEGSDTESWAVMVFSKYDLDLDLDVDQEDFGIFQACYSGDGMPYARDARKPICKMTTMST